MRIIRNKIMKITITCQKGIDVNTYICVLSKNHIKVKVAIIIRIKPDSLSNPGIAAKEAFLRIISKVATVDIIGNI